MKVVLVSIGIGVLLLALGVWGYLILFSTPSSTQEVFVDLGLQEQVDRPTIEPEVTLPELDETQRVEQIVLTSTALQQLTTKSVAGAVHITSSTSPRVRYVSAGTGHIFDIDLTSGTVARVSGTTVAGAHRAVFSPDGSHVAISTITNSGKLTTTGTLTTQGLELLSLPSTMQNILFTETGELHYTLQEEAGTNGYAYTIQTGVTTPTFTAPFKQLHTFQANGEQYAYNKPAARLLGSLYNVSNTGAQSVLPATYGFTAIGSGNNSTIIINDVDPQTKTLQSYSYNLDTKQRTLLPLSLLPEKCSFATTDTNTIWCAATLEEQSGSYIDAWHKGIVTSNDILWQIDLTTQEAQVLSVLQEDANRTLDVEYIKMYSEAGILLFSNKLDGTLWHYDTKI